jgi:DNA polymerase-3 subunit delta'
MVNFPLDWHMSTWKQLYKLAKNNQLPHALLFDGPSGLGKSRFGHAFAQLLLCECPSLISSSHLSIACNKCQSCLLFEAHTHPNYYVVEPEQSNNSRKIVIDQIRNLTDTLQKTAKNIKLDPSHHYSSIVLIHEAEYLHTAASNALLKTLEEPLSGVLFCLIANQSQHLLATIKSRCQKVNLAIPNFQTGVNWLNEQINKQDKSISLTHIETALYLADYLPLKALHLIEQPEHIEYYSILFEAFINLIKGGSNPIEMAQKWSTYPLDLTFNYFYQIIHYCIKLKIGVIDPKDHLIRPSEDWSGFIRQFSIERLFRHLDELKKLRSEINTYALNQLLTLEKLAFQFSSS